MRTIKINTMTLKLKEDTFNKDNIFGTIITEDEQSIILNKTELLDLYKILNNTITITL
jgi:hypothetical protein